MPRGSLLEYLGDFRRHGSDIATVHRTGYRAVRWRYRRIAETAAQFARELEARKVERGDRVLLWGGNCAEWVAAFWGCLLRGAVVVPMDRIASDDFALRVCRQTGARVAVCSREHAAGFAATPTLILETLAETVARHSHSPFAAPELGRQDLAEIIFTSGTTAEPKGVMISHGNILANLEPLEAGIHPYLKYEWLVHPLRFLNLLPLSHVFGQFLGLFVPPLLSATVIFEDSLNPSEVMRTIHRERVSVLVAVPRLLESLRDKMERDLEAEGKLDWFRGQIQAAGSESFLRRWWRFRSIHNRFGWKFWALNCGGATLDPDVEMFWSRLGFAVVQGYGLTETTSLISLNHPFRLSKGSLGRVLPGREIKLDDSGEILVRGESISSGYWREPDEAPSAAPGSQLRPGSAEPGWFHTGDLGAIDEKGNLYFKGRKKNVIVTSEGMNIYPEDLEAELRRQPEVRDCAVVGIERGGREEPCAVLILRAADQDAAPESIIQRANQALAAYQQMRCWTVWPAEDFPRTGTQKSRTSAIREAVQAQFSRKERPAEPPATPESDSPLSGLIQRITGHAPAALAPDARLETDLNLTSVDRVELLSAMEDRYQIDLDENRFAAATTVRELERMLRQPIPSRSDDKYPRWAQRWPVLYLRLIAYYLLTWPATLLLGRPRVRGRENLRGIDGPALVVCNHVTEIDPALVLFALPGRLRRRLAVAMNAERLQAMRHPSEGSGWLRRKLDQLSYALLVALFNVFPLPKQSGFRASFQFAGESVDRGYSILVFPEGELTKDGRISPFRAGIGVLANNLNIPVIPVRLDGLFELKQAGKKMTRPGSVKVTLGRPMRFDPAAVPASIAREIQACVASLGEFSAT